MCCSLLLKCLFGLGIKKKITLGFSRLTQMYYMTITVATWYQLCCEMSQLLYINFIDIIGLVFDLIGHVLVLYCMSMNDVQLMY